MKITRLSKVKQHRIFRDFNWPAGLPEFAQFNLIYGWNGAGKTTLSNLFAHLQSKQAITEGEVQIRVDDRHINQAEISDAVLPQIRVFNRDTVKRSIFESVHEKLPPVYYLGEDSADKQAKIEQLQATHTELSQSKAQAMKDRAKLERNFEGFCADQAKAIKNLLTAAGSEFNNYNAQKFKQRCETLKNQRPLLRLSPEDTERQMATKASSIKDAVPVPQANYPDFASLTQRVNELLGSSVVAATIDELTNDQPLSSWIRTGLDLHRGNRSSAHCRFCEQELPAGRIERLEAHFNDAFNRFQAEIANLLNEAKSARRFVTELRVPDKGLLYEHLVKDYEATTLTLNQQSMLVNRFLDAFITALEVKAGKPFQRISLLPFISGDNGTDSNSGALLKLFEVFVAAGNAIGAVVGKQSFDRLCRLIEAHNQHGEQFETAQRAARVALETEEIAKVLDDYVIQQAEIERLGVAVNNVDAEIAQIEGEITQLNTEIRQHFKAAEELTQDMASYLGRDELKFIAHDGGYSMTRNGQPALHLSEGERTAVSFIYFLKSLVSVWPTHPPQTPDFQVSVVSARQRCGSNSPMRLFGWLGRRVSTSFR